MKLGVLVSGHLGFNFLNAVSGVRDIVFVMTDKSSTDIITHCSEKSFPLFIGNPRSQDVVQFIADKTIDVLISVNYLYLINENLISIPKKIAFNVHGSLLPKYRGRTPHVWAIINNEVETGITAHMIEKGCDSGMMIKQIKIPIGENDTGADILNKFKNRYNPFILDVLNDLENDAIKLKSQEHSKATYFGKRTPEDGEIDWNWQKERIRNWVRAIAYPYPGAFTFYEDTKFIIDEIIFDNYGFNYDMPNGLILSGNPLLIKTPNGVIRVTKMRTADVIFKPGKNLNLRYAN